MPSRSKCIKILLIYALYTNSQGKCPLYFIKFILTEKWVCCKHFKSFIFEVFVDKRGQVAGNSMTHSRRSSGGSRLLMKALLQTRKCWEKNKNVIYLPRSVRIGKNCALGLEYGPVNNIYLYLYSFRL